MYYLLFYSCTFCRTLKNLNTRIDASVPKSEKVANPRDVKNYYVLVVTKIIHVKSGEHSSDDIVQFMVCCITVRLLLWAKFYTEFEIWGISRG